MQNNKTLTNLTHEQIILFLLAKNSNIYEAKRSLSEEEKGFINKIGAVLCDKNIKSDKDLNKTLSEIATNDNNNNNFLAELLKTINQDQLSENDRMESQNIPKNSEKDSENLSSLYYFSNKRENNLADGMKNGTLSGSKAFKIINKNSDLKGKNFLDSEYADIYLTKYDINDRTEFGKTFNIPILPESLFKIVIAILTFFSKYYETVYFDYKNQSKLEVITVELLKILNKNKYDDLDIKYLIDEKKGKPVGVVIKFLDAQNIEEKHLSIASVDDNNKKSFIKTLAEAFILDICDRTTMFNMMIHKDEYINIDYGLKYEKNDHTKVIKKFCKALEKKNIEQAKKIFLSEIKEETEFKIALFKRQEFFTRESNQQFIEERKRVYNFAKAILDSMSNEEFVKIFSDLLNQEKVTEISEVFSQFSLNKPEYKKMHCDIAQNISLVFASIEQCNAQNIKNK